MPARLILLCHGRTAARPSAFPDDEALAGGETERIDALRAVLGPLEHTLSSAARAARQTAGLLSSDVSVEPRLSAIDLARWRGRDIDGIEASEPQALALWMQDPDFSGHGGESRTLFAKRVSEWLAGRDMRDGTTLAVTHTSVVQAAVAAILGAPPMALRGIDAGPLQALDLRSDGRRWAIRSLGKL